MRPTTQEGKGDKLNTSKFYYYLMQATCAHIYVKLCLFVLVAQFHLEWGPIQSIYFELSSTLYEPSDVLIQSMLGTLV